MTEGEKAADEYILGLIRKNKALLDEEWSDLLVAIRLAHLSGQEYVWNKVNYPCLQKK